MGQDLEWWQQPGHSCFWILLNSPIKSDCTIWIAKLKICIYNKTKWYGVLIKPKTQAGGDKLQDWKRLMWNCHLYEKKQRKATGYLRNVKLGKSPEITGTHWKVHWAKVRLMVETERNFAHSKMSAGRLWQSKGARVLWAL